MGRWLALAPIDLSWFRHVLVLPWCVFCALIWADGFIQCRSATQLDSYLSDGMGSGSSR